MSKIGYVRVSTKDQKFDRQHEKLKDEKVELIFEDKLSGKDTNRPKFQELLNYIRNGDIVVVTELDRLGRNNKELTETMDILKSKGATVEILNLPTFKDIKDENLRQLLNNLILELYKYQAESERKSIRERQQQGIEISKQKGIYKGRPTDYSYSSKNPQKRLTYFKILEMLEHGVPIKQISEQTGVSRPTIYKIKKKM
ncbi:recombinase family protein [Carnobacterium divergens]|uniref:recombinase family protein n=1 Tax=Carnobacterium divergens TaxID=2748 RepID=UPI00288E6157|nr:recombinase family protein [Carnobacterium divergens]MDT2012579.1 recombinase family protein [Carnobacterium divergens]